MPRKSSSAAKSETRRAHEARLQYLSRNPHFIRDINFLAKLSEALPGKQGVLTSRRLKAISTFRAILEERAEVWRVSWLVLNQLSQRGWGKDRDPKDSIPAAFNFMDSPVIAWTDAQISSFLDVTRTAPFGASSSNSPEDARYLNLVVDLEHPADTLLPLIEKDLSHFSRKYRYGRRRLDKVSFNIQVFDCAEAGETFKDIGSKLKRSLSTVKSAYITACQNIYGHQRAPSKKALSLENFDSIGHCQTCRACRKATTAKELCGKARLHLNRDIKGQRERPGYNTVTG